MAKEEDRRERIRVKIKQDAEIAAKNLLTKENYERIRLAKIDSEDKNDPALLEKEIAALLKKYKITADLNDIIKCIVKNCAGVIW